VASMLCRVHGLKDMAITTYLSSPGLFAAPTELEQTDNQTSWMRLRHADLVVGFVLS
jgi:hypothetical protein